MSSESKLARFTAVYGPQVEQRIINRAVAVAAYLQGAPYTVKDRCESIETFLRSAKRNSDHAGICRENMLSIVALAVEAALDLEGK